MRYRVKEPLAIWRYKAGYSQAELAQAMKDANEDLRVTQSTISNWEKGKDYPNALEIAELEKLLKIKWSDDIILPKVLHKK